MTRYRAAVAEDESPYAAVFTAAERNGQLSVEEYEKLANNLALLLSGIHTANVRAVLKPKPTPYPGYALTQKGYREEQVQRDHNRPNSIREVAANLIPIRLYHETQASFIIGLVDEFAHIGDVELMFITSDNAIIDPTGRSQQVYTNLSPSNISSLMFSAMQLEAKAKDRTEAFFEQERRGVDIKVSFYGVSKSINPSTPIMIVFDFLIM